MLTSESLWLAEGLSKCFELNSPAGTAQHPFFAAFVEILGEKSLHRVALAYVLGWPYIRYKYVTGVAALPPSWGRPVDLLLNLHARLFLLFLYLYLFNG